MDRCARITADRLARRLDGCASCDGNALDRESPSLRPGEGPCCGPELVRGISTALPRDGRRTTMGGEERPGSGIGRRSRPTLFTGARR